ncbi:protein SLOW GREEN 1, chloroplastic-like isoform X1 [Populus nigra]|uniref:protein SLOW GREEN 1, chloroplastic-like isoform X1 n=1 Tax=Populus nigra TaxID=3691 RepID=UPI002B27230F|nr:protein SLOW GREEN 1, chloroplastic-like isoform X1 [Populus nigra]
MGSIKTFSPCSPPSHFQNLKSSKNCNSSTSLKPLLCSMNPLNIHSRHKLHISSNICSKSPFPQIPTSSISKTNNNFTSFLSEKVLVSLVGAFIFIGSFGLNTRQSLALPAQTSGGSVNLEGKRDAQMVKSEDEEMYEKVLEKEPRNVEALKVVLHWKMRRGQTKEAVKYVERLIEIEPEEVEWRLLEALCYEMMGQLNKAKRLFNEILEERPLLLRALHGLALVMHKNLEGPAVFEMLNKALEVAHREKRVTEERNIRILIAQMHVVKGDFEEALKKFQGLVSDNPRDFRPYLCQGIIYSLLDRKEEAAEQFETYRSLVPEEFPQRIFLDDVVLEAKTKSRERFQKEFQAEFSYRK